MRARGEDGKQRTSSKAYIGIKAALDDNETVSVTLHYCIAAAARRQPCLGALVVQKNGASNVTLLSGKHLTYAAEPRIMQWSMEDCYDVLVHENTFVKHEIDWKKVYIARKEGAQDGHFTVRLPATHCDAPFTR